MNGLDEALVNAWNEHCPTGTPVAVVKDDFTVHAGTTRSQAWVLCGTPVVSVTGISGGFSLDRIVPRTEKCDQ